MNAVTAITTQKLNVLFVDDEKNILIPLRAMFKRDYQVFTANSGAEALEVLHEHPVHVLVSDQRMPEMSGVELLEKVRHYSPATVRILLTGYSDLTAAVSSINEGAVFRFIEKPWDNQKLRETVKLASEVAQYQLHSHPETFATLPPPQDILNHEPSLVTPAEPPRGVMEQVDPDLPPGDVLVVDDDRAVLREIHRLFGTRRRIHYATDMEGAIDTLNQHDIAVLVIDTRVHGEETIGLIHILKRNYPALVSIVLTGEADAQTVIRLINQGQVFRYLTKPVRAGQLKISVQSAIKYHATYLADGHSPSHAQIVETPEEVHVQQSVNRLVTGLKSLWQRLTHH